MLTESTIQPTEIYIDKIECGRARLLCRWNISAITRDDQTIYQYEEAVLWWTFPYFAADGVTVLNNITAIEKFMLDNKADILNYARGTLVSLVGKDKHTPTTYREKDMDKKEEKEFTVKGK